MDLFGFEAPSRPARQAPPPVQEAPPPVRAVPAPPPPPPPVVALPVSVGPLGEDLPPWKQPRRPMAERSLQGCADIENVTDGATLSLAYAFQGWQLTPPGKAYSGMTFARALLWAIASLEADGWLRPAAEPGPASRFVLDVHPPVNCGLEVYQLLTQMLAAVQAGQVVVSDPQDAAALKRWAGHAERTLFNHRQAAIARKEPHV
ncbi:hypothetical protein IBL26_18835 [Roseomonas aerophila]|uniref:Uncharacterized protein n=1 Tax=Teichococcus aerophilus TaxID=1224513 RepID=A0ABR7RQL6_9PROT|nr:hypothetical protein [Pseudoroseomonas aerophila]MBC9208910.1 hypothetical protein [Pseudoroseomonas aerophila]